MKLPISFTFLCLQISKFTAINVDETMHIKKLIISPVDSHSAHKPP